MEKIELKLISRYFSLQNIERRIKTECGEGYGIDIGSEPGKGTEVTVHLPVVEKESETSIE